MYGRLSIRVDHRNSQHHHRRRPPRNPAPSSGKASNLHDKEGIAGPVIWIRDFCDGGNLAPNILHDWR